MKPIPTKTDKGCKFNYIPIATIEFQQTKLQQSKVAGFDNLTTGLLKDLDKEVSSSLCCIINRPINTGVFPSSWKTAKVTPVDKAVSATKIKNYRPGSILYVVKRSS